MGQEQSMQQGQQQNMHQFQQQQQQQFVQVDDTDVNTQQLDEKKNILPNSKIINSNNTYTNNKRKRDFTDSINDSGNQSTQQNTQDGRFKESVTYSAEIQVKKIKDNNQKQINLNLIFDNDINNVPVNIPEKWGNQSASLKSSIELLGSNSLNNYEKSAILKQLALGDSNAGQQQGNNYKLQQISQMLDSFPEDYVKINSVSCNLYDKKTKQTLTSLKLTASAEVAQLLQQRLSQENSGINMNENEFKKLYQSLVNGSSGQSLQTTNFTSNGQQSTVNDYIQKEVEEDDDEDDDDDEEEDNNKNTQKMEIEQKNQRNLQDSENLLENNDIQQYKP